MQKSGNCYNTKLRHWKYRPSDDLRGEIQKMQEETCRIFTWGKHLLHIFCDCFLIAVLFVFPLYYKDFYYDILPAKYQFYYMSVLALALAVLATGLVMMIFDLKMYEGANTKRFFRNFSPSILKKKLTAPEWFLIAFLAVAILSTLQSDYRYESFWGNEGRYTGLFLLLIYALSFWLIFRLGHMKNEILEIFLVSSLFVCVFGITDYLDLNLLHFKDRIAKEQYTIFTSTFGNINTYTAFVSLALGLSGFLFSTERRGMKCFWHYSCMLVAMAALITGQSDNAYLALMAMFGLLPLYLFRNWEGVKRYGVIVATFFTVVQIVDWISQHMSGQVLELDGLFRVLVQFPGLLYVVVAFWLLVLLLYGAEKFVKNRWLLQNGRLQKAWGIVLIFIAVAVVLILLDANVLGHGERYSAVSNYVILNDDWGTHRGFIWRIGMKNYMKQPFLHQLFGFGPDTFGILVKPDTAEGVQRYDQIFDSAHNEYLQYFLTIGPLGLAAYLGFLGTSIWTMIRHGKRNIYAAGCAFSALCYGAQAMVNINLPIATPIMWTLLMVGLGLCRTVKKESKSD